jgi:hypothetical protein
LNLHIYKTVKDFKTSSLTDIAAANVCTMQKTRGLYHVSERRNFNFSPSRFSEIVAILTAPAVKASMFVHHIFLAAVANRKSYLWAEKNRNLICGAAKI